MNKIENRIKNIKREKNNYIILKNLSIIYKMDHPLKKPKVIRAKAPDAHLYTKPKKDRKITDKDLFVMTSKRDLKKK